MDNIKMLIVEDDPYLGLIVKDFFETKGYEVTYCANAEEGLEVFKNTSFDICLLDVILPKRDGFELARDIRNIDKKVPIIFLTAQTMKDDIIKGFTVGADDYIKKPFVMEELILRVNAVLRRTNRFKEAEAGEEIIYKIDNFIFNYNLQKLSNEDETIELTYKEAELLKLFCDNVNEIVDRKYVLNKLWEDDSFFNSRSMDVYVAKLRKYLKGNDNIEIVNIRGKGFKLRVKE